MTHANSFPLFLTYYIPYIASCVVSKSSTYCAVYFTSCIIASKHSSVECACISTQCEITFTRHFVSFFPAPFSYYVRAYSLFRIT